MSILNVRPRPADPAWVGRGDPVAWDDDDGSEYHGFHHNGAYTGACVVRSAARIAADAATNNARTATETQIANFRQSIRELAQAVKDSGGLTVAQRLTLLSQLSVKLARVADGVLADL